MHARLAWLAALVLGGLCAPPARAQSITGAITGIVRDQQQAAIDGASVAVRSLDTNATEQTQTSSAGVFRFIALPPGAYELTVAHRGFRRLTYARLPLTINQQLVIPVTLEVSPVEEQIDVVPSAVDVSNTGLGRTIDSRQIDALPVASRDFSTLAQLSPGVLVNRSGLAASPTNAGIAAAGQFSRNNRFLVDGLLYDRFNTGTPRPGYALDTVREFAVLTNTFSAEYGQAAGAVVTAVTRSGTNRLSGRSFYFHRDDALDATPGSARLAGAEKARLEQSQGGGFHGGPWRRDRIFYFGSAEFTRTDNDWIVSSPTLATFRPGEPAVFPNVRRAIDLFGRTDAQLARHRATLRAHYTGSTVPHSTTENPRTRVARERTNSSRTRAYELGIVDSLTLGTRGVNEARLQFSTLQQDLEGPYCPGCPSENRPSLLLGASPNPQDIREEYWQFADTFTWLADDAVGDHVFKAGVDIIRARNVNDALINGSGTFFFASDQATAAPTRFEQRLGPGVSDLHTNLYALFVQDEWKPTAMLTVNAGLRWDYVDSIGISRRADNVAPRLGVSADPWRSGRSAIRSSIGRYYDSVYVQTTRNEALASQQRLMRLQTPVYVPWTPGTPFVNPLAQPGGAATADADTATIVTKDIPYTDQASLGVQSIFLRHRLSVDGVYARGRNLLLTRDQNYPLNVGIPGTQRIRPNPQLGRVLAVESIGNSWHSALLVGAERQFAGGHSYSLAYTWSSTERDTEQGNHLPFDHRDPEGDRGPSLSDVRHRFVGSGGVMLPLGSRLAAILIAESAAPYNVTLGQNSDINLDGFTNDRPAGVRRNSVRGDDFCQLDVRLSKTFAWGARRLDLLVDAFNVLNRRNWTAFNGDRTASTFGQPQNAEPPRQIQLGIRFDF